MINVKRRCYGTDRRHVLFHIAIYLLLITVFISSHAFSDVALPSIFGDNMVLQRSMKVPVWGTADPGEKVIVAINGKQTKTTTGKDGRWNVTLKKMNAGGPYEMTVSGNNTITFSNVLVGEVWVCSGQSNMQFSLANLKNIDDKINAADYPDIRLFSVDRISRTTPQYDFQGKQPEWVECTPETVKSFSAVGYFFGKEIHEELDVPVGLIHSSWGGSIAEAWTRLETLDSIPELRPITEDMESLAANYPKAKAEYDAKRAEQLQARSEGKTVTNFIIPPRGPETRDWPAGLFNAMIAPMIPYGIQGAIWYQGESNSARAHQYRTLFPAMISDWRKAWGQGNFPFIYVQLANWETDTIGGAEVWGSWPELREAQLMTLDLPKTAMAVTIDIGDPNDIHPNNKWDVGKRLALGALHVAYGRNILYSGPVFKSMRQKKNVISLNFKHCGNGLRTRNGEPLRGFEIAGKDKVFYEADARIEGNKVFVTSSNVSQPVAVRYAWDDNPVCNLYNSGGLPASPFRTDDWPCITEGKLKP